MDKKTDAIITQLIKDKKVLDQENIQRCFLEAKNRHASPVRLIAECSHSQEAELLKVIAQQFNIEYLELKNLSVEKNLIKKIPVKIASYYKFVPVILQNRLLTIASAYPLSVKMQDEIRTHLGYNLKTVLSCEEDVNEMLKKYYGLGAATVEKIMAQKTYKSIKTTEREDRVEDLEEVGETASVIQLVNQIILEAYKKRATDIHIEPYRDKLRLRYRIDGILYDANVNPEIKHFLIPILSRIKLMSNLNIVERRVPQDGRAIVKVQDQTLDLRVSFIPTPHGESVVIRILPMIMLFSLDKLGLRDTELNFFKELINKPHGIIFVTGPTGSGKTTTLYACLSSINSSERKIITIEDPIEYELEGITQLQVAPEIGLDFARGLRSMLRHDPDVMMVGEVRDLETAEIAIRVALTGHLVFSTLHTNDAASGITRLIDIGLEPYLVASSVDAFIAQRLIRLNCPHCKIEDKQVLEGVKHQIARELGNKEVADVKIYRGKGCPECNFTGFYGRTAIHEILLVDEAIKDLSSRKASSDQIKKLAVSRGMRTLRQSGWLKVLEGITTPDEILRVTQADELSSEESTEDNLAVKATVEQKIDTDKDKSVEIKEQPERYVLSPERKHDYMDRRIYERVEEHIYVRFKIFRQKAKGQGTEDYEPELIGITKNISAGGALFSTLENLGAGKVIDISIELPDEEKEMQCLARVIRCIENAEEKNYEVAVCFLDLPSSERSRLNRFIMRLKE